MSKNAEQSELVKRALAILGQGPKPTPEQPVEDKHQRLVDEVMLTFPGAKIVKDTRRQVQLTLIRGGKAAK
jgi:hypothetical protein